MCVVKSDHKYVIDFSKHINSENTKNRNVAARYNQINCWLTHVMYFDTFTDTLSQIRDHITQRIKLILLHRRSLDTSIIHFNSVSSKRRKVRVVLNQSSMPKTRITIGIVRNTITTCCRKNTGFIKKNVSCSLLCSEYTLWIWMNFAISLLSNFWHFSQFNWTLYRRMNLVCVKI